MNPNELKSAEELENDRLMLIGQLAYCANTKDWKRFESLIKSNELKAFRAGMTESAEITKQGDGYEHKSGYWSEKILDARDRKESL